MADTPVTPRPPEAELVALYRATVVPVHRYLSKLTGGDRTATEDLTQEVYLAALTALRRSPGEALGPGWLMVTARNAFLQRLRSTGRRERREAVVVQRQPLAPPPDAEAAVGDHDQARRLLASLSPDQRAAFVLRHADDLPVAEVAALLGRTPRATQSLLVRAEARMRAIAQEARP